MTSDCQAGALGRHSQSRDFRVEVVQRERPALVPHSLGGHAQALSSRLEQPSAALGQISPLSKGEAEMAGAYSLRERPMGRAWEYWTTRLSKAGELPPRVA